MATPQGRRACPVAEVIATTTLRPDMAGLSTLGVLLALAGLYAAMSLLAVRRTHEFGVRLSLGARPAACSPSSCGSSERPYWPRAC